MRAGPREVLRAKDGDLKRIPGVQIGWWALIALTLMGALALYTDIRRLENPVGEKYFGSYYSGQTDFSYPYLGARALLAGVNPYHNNRPEFNSPYFLIEHIDGVDFKQLYAPGHFILLIPLARWWGGDWESAARVWFHLLLAALAGLVIITWALFRRITQLALTPLWIPVIAGCLILNHGVELGIERGQSDIVTALFCWGAVLCFLRRRVGTAIFLTVCGTCIKGYPILFAMGMGLFALTRKSWRRAMLGGTLASAIVVLPGVQYLGDAIKGMQHRAEMFSDLYYNLGMRNVVYYMKSDWADSGRSILSAMALGITMLAWFQARRALKRGSTSCEALWLTVFTTASLGTMMGYSALSVTYNLVLILPGTFIIVASQKRLGALIALPGWARHLLGAALLCVVFTLFTGILGAIHGDWSAHIPVTGFGLLLLFLILAPHQFAHDFNHLQFSSKGHGRGITLEMRRWEELGP